MTTAELLGYLHGNDVSLWAEGLKLRYRAPDGVITPELRAELTGHRHEILALLSGTALPTNRADGLARRQSGPCSLPVPLSFSQERIWFLSQMEPDSCSYNVTRAIRIQGPLDLAALGKSFREILRRHEILRSSTLLIDGQVFQRFDSRTLLKMPVIDLRQLSGAKRETEVLRHAAREGKRPFDLTMPPSLRVSIMHLDHEDYVLLLTTHHFSIDGWSMRKVLLLEISELYEAFSAARDSPLTSPNTRFSDFIRWQRRRLKPEYVQNLILYWKRALLGAATVLDLPTDHPDPLIQGNKGTIRHFKLPRQLTEAIRELSRKEGVTLFMFLLAAFQTILYRYTNHPDIIVGTAVSLRDRQEFEDVVGPFTNMLALRVDFSGDPTFRELLARVREVTAGAFAHQELPFERLIEELQPERDLRRNPLFQVMFVLHQYTTIQNLEIPKLKLTAFPVETGSARFDLGLEMEDGKKELTGALEYRSDLFERTTIDRFLLSFRTLLEGAVASPEERVSRLPALTLFERNQLIVEFNKTEQNSDIRCIDELFEKQVANSPEAMAVIFGEEHLSYAQLNARANRLATHLRRLGLGPEKVVGLCVERSTEMVITMIGILKAGGAYLPLDPSYPAARLSDMVNDSGTSLILTHEHLLPCIPESNARIVCLDRENDLISRNDEQNLSRMSLPDNLAYVIYTSGSTGKPKGIAVAHRSVASLLGWAKNQFDAHDLAGVLASTSICFDLSVFEIFIPLCAGGTIILAENAMYLGECSAGSRITLINTVPSVAAELFKAGYVAASVRVVNLAGEPLRSSVAQLAYSQPNIRRVFNLYGPSETTVYSAAFLAGREGAKDPPIGNPIDNTRTYILDSNLEPVPIGVTGELFIGGTGLARCYLNQPSLTAERFIPDPFSTIGGERIYRTGDLARYRQDGAIEFLGRIDEQIKIRGYRIEPGEIESMMEEHPGVDRAVALQKGQMIIAYICPSNAPCQAELKTHLRMRLPEYMIPSHFVRLPKLPSSPGGKIDKSALLKKRFSKEQSLALAPGSAIEKAIAWVWREMLGIDGIGVHENFFDLGGHSLLLIQVHRRLVEILRRNFPMIELFRNPTIATLSSYLAGQRDLPPGQIETRAKRQAEAIRKQAQLTLDRRKKKDG